MWAAQRRKGSYKGRQRELTSQQACPDPFPEPRPARQDFPKLVTQVGSCISTLVQRPSCLVSTSFTPVSYVPVPSLNHALPFPDVSPSLPKPSSLRWLGSERPSWCCWEPSQGALASATCVQVGLASPRHVGTSAPGSSASPTLPTSRPVPELARLPPLTSPCTFMSL